MKKALHAIIATLTLASCSSDRPKLVTAFDGFAQGTYYHIVAISDDSLHIEGALDSLFAVADNSMSIFNPGSRLSRLNGNLTDTLDVHIKNCIEVALHVGELSSGLYDITVKPLTQAWGFAAERSEYKPNLDSLLQIVGYRKIEVRGNTLLKDDPRIQIDLNSIAKGYTADLLAQLLEQRGVENYLVELGGEIVTRGDNPQGKPWTVGIDSPEDNSVPGEHTRAMLRVHDSCIATSGNYRNFRYDEGGQRVAHTINPLTGSSTPGDMLSATVMAPSCALADATATALMASGSEKAIKLIEGDNKLSAYIIYICPDGQVKTWMSPEMSEILVR